LTEVGRSQAEALGKEWANTRIDYLTSSHLERAHDTAKALSDHNEGHPEVHIEPLLEERRYGRRVPELMRYDSTAGREELTGRSAYSLEGGIKRSHRPAEGGESLEGVALRGESIIRLLLHRGVISEPPEFLTNKETTTAPAVLPDGIPHVVIVSHNIFLSELYEKLRYWRGGYKETTCHYRNASW
jgi:broad specificity phosphatase PhoE